MPGIFTAPNWFKRRVINVKSIVLALGIDDDDDIGRFCVNDNNFNLLIFRVTDNSAILYINSINSIFLLNILHFQFHREVSTNSGSREVEPGSKSLVG